MDDTIRLILTVGAPIAAIAATWGAARFQIRQLADRDREREKEFDAFREQDRERSHALNVQLAGALDSLAGACSKVMDWEDRRGAQIDRNTQRGRSNRTRIEGLEAHDREAAIRRLRSAGVSAEHLDEITGVMQRPVGERSELLQRAEPR